MPSPKEIAALFCAMLNTLAENRFGMQSCSLQGARGLAPRGLRTLRLLWARIGCRGKGLLFHSAHNSMKMFKVVRCGSAGVEVQLGVIDPGALSAEKASWTLVFSFVTGEVPI